MNENTATASRKLAIWSAGLRYEDIPADVMDLAKLRFLDAIGVRIAAQRTGAGVALRRVLMNSFLPAHMQGPGRAVFPPFDAFLNGTMTACLDFDDTHDETLIHPSSAIVPALFSSAQRSAIKGKDFLTALVAGYEVCCRIGTAAPGQFHKKGFHPTGIIGAVGAAAAVARAFDYDALRTEHALGLAASVGGGLLQAIVDGTDARYVNSGSAAMNGILACNLAAEGFTAAGGQLDGKFGLLRAHVQTEADLRIDRATEQLGDRWEARGITPKPYPTGYVTHEFIDAILRLAEQHDLHADQIEKIECTVVEAAARLTFIPLEQKRSPHCTAAARVAMPHILAEALVFREIGPDSFSGDRMQNPLVKALALKTHYRLGESQNENELRITAQGRQIGCKTSRRAMSGADIIHKFIANVQPALGLTESQAVVDAVLNAEESADFGTILSPGLEPGMPPADRAD